MVKYVYSAFSRKSRHNPGAVHFALDDKFIHPKSVWLRLGRAVDRSSDFSRARLRIHKRRKCFANFFAVSNIVCRLSSIRQLLILHISRELLRSLVAVVVGFRIFAVIAVCRLGSTSHAIIHMRLTHKTTTPPSPTTPTSHTYVFKGNRESFGGCANRYAVVR